MAATLSYCLLALFASFVLLLGTEGKLNTGAGNFDIVLMVEKTNGVDGRKKLAKALIEKLNVGPDNDRLALYSYVGQDMKVFYELTGSPAPNKQQALTKVASIKKKSATKKTDMYFELNTAASDRPNSFMPPRTLRARSRKLLVFVASAGVGAPRMKEATKALTQLKNRGIETIFFDYKRGASTEFVNALKAKGGKHIPFTDADNIQSVVNCGLGNTRC